MPPDPPHISDAARDVVRAAVELGLADARGGEPFLAFLVVGGPPTIEQMVPGPGSADPVRAALDMAERRVAELPQGTAFCVARDAFLHDGPGKTDAVVVEFGIAGTPERHFAAQRYRRSRWLRRFRKIGGLIYLADPKFAVPASAGTSSAPAATSPPTS